MWFQHPIIPKQQSQLKRTQPAVPITLWNPSLMPFPAKVSTQSRIMTFAKWEQWTCQQCKTAVKFLFASTQIWHLYRRRMVSWWLTTKTGSDVSKPIKMTYAIAKWAAYISMLVNSSPLILNNRKLKEINLSDSHRLMVFHGARQYRPTSSKK